MKEIYNTSVMVNCKLLILTIKYFSFRFKLPQNMKNASYFLLVILCTFLTLSCQSIELLESRDYSNTMSGQEIRELRFRLAKSIAKAMANESVRELIKNEASKKFNGDTDILLAMLMDKKVGDNSSFRNILRESLNDNEIKSILRNIPLATLYVPELKNFSTDKWDTKLQVPMIAVIDDHHDEIKTKELVAYTTEGAKSISAKNEPDSPVIVLKDNERIISHDINDQSEQGMKMMTENGEPIFVTASHKFYFFLGVNPKAGSRARKQEYLWGYEQFLKYPYSQSLESHRDYIYYGIDPSTGANRGTFKQNFTERLVSMRFLSIDGVNAVTSDWTEGDLEFRFNHIFANRNGGSESQPKVFYCQKSAIYTPAYGTFNDVIMNIELKPWDMYTYGNEWCINVIEFDNGAVSTKTTVNTFEWGTNFEGNLSLIEKVGIKFGVTTKSTRQVTTSIQTTDTSEDLGLSTHYFSDPIVINDNIPVTPRPNSRKYETFERSTGAVSFSMETVQSY